MIWKLCVTRLPKAAPAMASGLAVKGVVPVAAVALRQLERAQAVDGDGAVRAGGIQRYAVCLAVDADGEGMRIVEGPSAFTSASVKMKDPVVPLAVCDSVITGRRWCR